MTLSNPWFLAALIAILGLFHLDLIATLLNLSRYSLPLPKRLKDVFDEETVKKAAEYAGRSARVDLIRDAFFLALLIAVWWSGGFAWIDAKLADVRAEVEAMQKEVQAATMDALLALPAEARTPLAQAETPR